MDQAKLFFWLCGMTRVPDIDEEGRALLILLLAGNIALAEHKDSSWELISTTCICAAQLLGGLGLVLP